MRKQVHLDLCDYCYDEHQKLHTNHDQFNFKMKISVSVCIWCGSSMCQDCVNNSKKYIHETQVAWYELYLCAGCVLVKRSDMEYRTFVLDTIEKHEKYMRISLKKTILAWRKQPWRLLTWSSSTSTSRWSQRKNAPRVPSNDIEQDSVNLSNSLATSQLKT